MKIEIYNEKEEEEKKVFLELCEIDTDEVSLNVVDSKGIQATLLSITEEGIILRTGINPAIGLKLDSLHRLNVR